MATKTKTAKKKKAPAAKKQPARKISAPKVDAEMLAKQIQKLSARIRALESQEPIAGPAGPPGEPGPAGPQGEAANPAALAALEQRVKELEARLATPAEAAAV
jgi:hypothetical protein